MDDFSSIIGAWPTAEDFAADIGVHGGTARQWKRRNSIPPEYWARIVTAAQARKIESITHERLVSIAEALAKAKPADKRRRAA